jgi:succinylglutamate desuccinylase
MIRRRIIDALPSLANHARMRRRLAIGLMMFLTLFGAWGAVSTGVIAEGTRWEMAWRVYDSGQPGPTVLVVGGVHGNEPAGASAAAQIQHWPVKRGRLIVVPRANGPGLKDGTRFLPGVALKTRDLNRDFQKTDSKDGPIGEPAQALWKFVSGHKPDWLIDLHEGTDFHQINGKSVGSSIIDVHSKATDAAVPLMLKAVNAAVNEPKKKFVRLRYPVDGSLARAAHERLGAHAMICETTSKNQPRSQRARQHRLMVHALLTHLKMAQAGPHVLVGKENFRVAIYDAGGVGGNGPRNVDRVLAGHALVRRVGAARWCGGCARWRAGAVSPRGVPRRQRQQTSQGTGPGRTQGGARFCAQWRWVCRYLRGLVFGGS